MMTATAAARRGGMGTGTASDLGRVMFVTLAVDVARNLRTFVADAATAGAAAAWDLPRGVLEAMNTVLKVHVDPQDVGEIVDVLNDNALPSLLLATLRRLAALRRGDDVTDGREARADGGGGGGDDDDHVDTDAVTSSVVRLMMLFGTILSCEDKGDDYDDDDEAGDDDEGDDDAELKEIRRELAASFVREGAIEALLIAIDAGVLVPPQERFFDGDGNFYYYDQDEADDRAPPHFVPGRVSSQGKMTPPVVAAALQRSDPLLGVLSVAQAADRREEEGGGNVGGHIRRDGRGHDDTRALRLKLLQSLNDKCHNHEADRYSDDIAVAAQMTLVSWRSFTSGIAMRVVRDAGDALLDHFAAPCTYLKTRAGVVVEGAGGGLGRGGGANGRSTRLCDADGARRVEGVRDQGCRHVDVLAAERVRVRSSGGVPTRDFHRRHLLLQFLLLHLDLLLLLLRARR